MHKYRIFLITILFFCLGISMGSLQVYASDNPNADKFYVTEYIVATGETIEKEIDISQEAIELLENTIKAKELRLAYQPIKTKSNGISIREIVFDTDERYQITNTTTYPYRTICSLRLKWPNNLNAIIPVTGVVISKNLVLTSGHCVYQASKGGYARDMEVIPGRNGNTRPYGTFSVISYEVATNWISQGGAGNDLALIKVNGNIGTTVGTMNFFNYDDSKLRTRLLSLAGYPADKPTGTMWESIGYPLSLTSNIINHPIDTAGGQSGSPLFIPSTNQIVGIHSRAGQQEPDGTYLNNEAARINSERYAWLLTRKNSDQ